MRDNDNVLAPLEFHDNRLEANHNVTIRLAASIAIVVFVIVTGSKIFRVGIFDFLIGKAVTNTGIQLVEGFPL